MAALNAADALYLGSSSVDKAYIGSSQVWPPVALGIAGTLPGGTVGVPYSNTLTLTGYFVAPVTIDASSGSLPPWATVSVSGATITFSGTPTTAETEAFTVRATDSSGTPRVATSAQSITIDASSATYATLDPSWDGYGHRVSNGNLTLTCNGGGEVGGGAAYAQAGAAVDVATANKYLEVLCTTVSATSADLVGFAPYNYSNNAPGGNYDGDTPLSFGLSANGNVYANQGVYATGGTFASGDTLKLCLKNGKIYAGIAGGSWFNGGDPDAETGALVTGLTGSLLVPGAGAGGNITYEWTFNFGASAWIDTPPAGATGWTVP